MFQSLRAAAPFLACLLLTACPYPGDTAKDGGPVARQLAQPIEPAAPLAQPAQNATLVAPGDRIDRLVKGPSDIQDQRALPADLPIVQNAAGDFSLMFRNVDVAELVRVVMSDLLQVNYVMDDAIQGTLTVQTARPVAREALLPILESSLRSLGAGITVTPEGYQILPLEAAAQQLAPLAQGASVGILPVPLKNVAAVDMAELLGPIASERVQISVLEEQNMVVLAGERVQLNNLLALIDSLDVDQLSGKTFGLLPLRVADARVAAREMEAVFGGVGGTRFMAIERQNALLVIARDRTYLDTAETWIQSLDKRGGKNDKGIFIYQVESGSAIELATTVSQLFDLAGGQSLPEGPQDGAFLTPDLTAAGLTDLPDGGSSLGYGSPELGGGEQGLADPALPGDPDAEPAPDPFSGAPPAGDAVPVYQNGSMKIVPHPATNTIVVMATEDDWNRVETTLRRLDQVPLQVLIEATVVEVALNDQLRYGVQFALQSGDSLASLTDGLDLFPGPVVPGFNYLLSTGSFKVILDALSTITDLNVLSSPQLMVQSNESARLQVGDQVPVTVQSASPFDLASGVVVNTVEFRDTGVILNVTPRVSPSGLINLEIEQEVSDVVNTTTSNIDSPTISQRRIASTVAVQSGETIILGGLTRDATSRFESGIPVLRDTPVIGPLFGRTDNATARTELLVMIKPRIIRDGDDARAIANELRDRLSGIVGYDRPATGDAARSDVAGRN